MPILHPLFLMLFALMIFIYYQEENYNLNQIKTYFFALTVVMVVLAGGRTGVGADYPVYKAMYESGFPIYTTYADVWKKATFQPNSMEIEWLYVLVNKVFFDLGMPYYVLTTALATFSLTIYYKVFTRYSSFVSMSYLYYFMPLYFITECGQMRQGIGGALLMFSLQYAFDKKLFKFLLVIFIALGFHKTAIVFLPVYWLIHLKFNLKFWLTLLVISILLAPFKIYTLFGSTINALTPADVSNSFNGYSNDRYYGNQMKTGFADLINLFFVGIMIIYDKFGEKNVNYYKYYRNLAFFGFCLFYILRGNAIFATRLPGSYFAVAGYFIVPGILYKLRGEPRVFFRGIFLAYFLGFFVLFSLGNGLKGNFTWNTYKNVLWSVVK